MVHLSCLVFLLCVWFPLKTVSNNTIEEENTVPLLQDFKVKVFPGLIYITWNCNITKSMEEYLYNVIFQNDFPETLKVNNCSFFHEVHRNREFILHKGLRVQLWVKKAGKTFHKSKGVIYMPEGKNNSAAENFSCVIHSVSIMNCSWIVGKEAPEDTQYSLILRQTPINAFVKCQDYRTDSFGRQVGCVLKQPDISFKSKVYVEVLGISNQTLIQFFDEVYEPIDNIILGPPRNITLTYNSEELEIKWQKPETYNNYRENYFSYNINIKAKEENEQIVKDNQEHEENVYKTTKFQPNKKVTVTLRVKWRKGFSKREEWSAWSDPQTIGYDSVQLTPNQILIVVGVGTAIILIVLISLCYRFRIWRKLFPQVPKPSMKLFEQVEQKEKAGQKVSEIEIPFMNKDEECICSDVTETPEKF